MTFQFLLLLVFLAFLVLLDEGRGMPIIKVKGSLINSGPYPDI